MSFATRFWARAGASLHPRPSARAQWTPQRGGRGDRSVDSGTAWGLHQPPSLLVPVRAPGTLRLGMALSWTPRSWSPKPPPSRPYSAGVDPGRPPPLDPTGRPGPWTEIGRSVPSCGLDCTEVTCFELVLLVGPSDMHQPAGASRVCPAAARCWPAAPPDGGEGLSARTLTTWACRAQGSPGATYSPTPSRLAPGWGMSFLGGHNKAPQRSDLDNRHSSSHVLEAGSPRSSCGQGWFLLRPLPWACRCPSPPGVPSWSSLCVCVLIMDYIGPHFT